MNPSYDGSHYREMAFGYCYGMGLMADADDRELQGTREIPELILKLKDSGNGSLRAAIELKFARCPENETDIAVMDRLATAKAKEALKALNCKDYENSVMAKSDNIVRIGLGVTGRGWCKALVSPVTG
jgi:hypothetical protein